VSTRSFTAFPEDLEMGVILEPHYPLTYEKFRSYDFDENSTLRYVLEIIKENE